MALRTTAGAGGPLGEAAERALADRGSGPAVAVRHRVEALADVVVVPRDGPSVATDVLLAVGPRCGHGRCCACGTGTRPVGSSPTTCCTAAALVPAGVGPGPGDWRTFRLDGVEPLTPTGPRFAPRPVPGDDPAAFLEARFKGSAVRDAWPVVGRVVLRRPAADLAPFVGDGTLVDLGDGRSGLTLGSWSWPALAAAVARFDADAEDVSPAALRRAFGVLADRSSRAATGTA